MLVTAAEHKFWRHVLSRPAHCESQPLGRARGPALRASATAEVLGNRKLGDFGQTALRQEHALGFDVSAHPTFLMNMRQRLRETRRVQDRKLLADAPMRAQSGFGWPPVAVTVQHRPEIDACRDKLEREEAAYAHGQATCAEFAQAWEGVDIDEPASLDGRLRAATQSVRLGLEHYLAGKTRPDLEHVRASVLGTFDARSREVVERALFKNRTAASSANRSLRMRLTSEYKAFIAEQQSRAKVAAAA